MVHYFWSCVGTGNVTSCRFLNMKQVCEMSWYTLSIVYASYIMYYMLLRLDKQIYNILYGRKKAINLKQIAVDSHNGRRQSYRTYIYLIVNRYQFNM